MVFTFLVVKVLGVVYFLRDSASFIRRARRGFVARKRLFMAGMFCVRHYIPKLSAVRHEVSLKITEEAPRSILHNEPSNVLFVVLVGRINVVEKVAYRLHVLFVGTTCGNMKVHRATIRTGPPLIHVVARFVPTGVRASVCSAVVAIIAVTVLRPRFYEQVLTRLHTQIIGRGYLVKRQGEVCG